MGVTFGTEEGTFRSKFHPHWCNVWPLRGENPQNRPLSKLNNRHFALRAMLPVKKVYLRNHNTYFFTSSPRPPTLSQRHMDLRVSAYPRPGYIFQVSSKSVQGFRNPRGVKIWPFPLLWLVAFTTACTTVQAVKR